MSPQSRDFPLVDEPLSLRELTERLGGCPLLAIDTEFVREKTFYPELCVVQIATGEFAAAVDCLAAIDLGPLFDALLAADKIWLLHSARQDLEVLFNLAGGLPRRLIDTQIAAALLGNPLQIGLQSMLQNTLGVTIAKEHTRADWSRRPLTDALLSYALDDVRFLPAAWAELRTRLENAGRLAWFEEECERLLGLPIQPDTAALFERTKGAGGLTGKRRSAAMALLEWRETRAQQRNRPRRWILSDEQLVQIAMALPSSPSALRDMTGLPENLIARSGEAIVDAIRNAPATSDAPVLAAPDKNEVRRLQSAVKERAATLGVQPELLATRKDINLIAAGQAPAYLIEGWRNMILGDLLTGRPSDRAR